MSIPELKINISHLVSLDVFYHFYNMDHNTAYNYLSALFTGDELLSLRMCHHVVPQSVLAYDFLATYLHQHLYST